jgi:hypothetical protein
VKLYGAGGRWTEWSEVPCEGDTAGVSEVCVGGCWGCLECGLGLIGKGLSKVPTHSECGSPHSLYILRGNMWETAYSGQKIGNPKKNNKTQIENDHMSGQLECNSKNSVHQKVPQNSMCILLCISYIISH